MIKSSYIGGNRTRGRGGGRKSPRGQGRKGDEWIGTGDFDWMANAGLLYYLIQSDWPVNVEVKLHLEIAVIQTPCGNGHHRVSSPNPQPSSPLSSTSSPSLSETPASSSSSSLATAFACAASATKARTWDSTREQASAPIAACKCRNLFVRLLVRFLPSLYTLLRRPSFTSFCKLLVHPIGC